MSVKATIVVEFGRNADQDAVVIVELDDEINLDQDGNSTSNFYPGDKPGFIVHYDKSVLRIDEIKCSSGMIVDNGEIVRSRKQQIQFSKKPTFIDVEKEFVELTYIPSSPITVEWYGNSPILNQNGRRLTVNGDTPAIGNVEYKISCHSYQLIPPSIVLKKDETYSILIVVYMESI